MRPRRTAGPPAEAMLPSEERLRLRAAVLSAGAVLGWTTAAVIAFGEALTGVPWRRWGCAELEAALDELLGLLCVVRERAARAPRPGAAPARAGGGRRAARA